MRETADAYKLGGMATDTLTGRTPLILNIAEDTLAAAGHVHATRDGVDYVVTAGKTLFITGYMATGKCYGNNTSTTPATPIRYADDANLVTNPVAIVSPPPITTGSGLLTGIIVPMFASVPAGKYVGHLNATAAESFVNLIIFGYEA